MTNREKYNFDYFTIDHYCELVKLAKEQGFEFVRYTDSDLLLDSRKEILWRHDVEFSPDIALEMARIENQLEVVATYFFQIHSEFYNIFEAHFSNVLREIKELGHVVALHFDPHFYGINDEERLEKYLNIDKTYFEQVFDLKLEVFSFHCTNKFILSCEKEKYANMLNAYSSFFKNNYQYCADSTGYWRYEVLDEVLSDNSVEKLQVLTHDAMWSKEVLSPRQRVRTSIQNNAERIKNRYDQILIEFGANNIDD